MSNTAPPDAWELAGAQLDAVEACMLRLSAAGGDDVLGTVVGEHLGTGGKRLRARLAVAACEALGGRASAAVPWGAACELFHNGTLIHDDLQDGDDTRRGSPTVWARHGMPQAVNAGDLMLLLPFSAVMELDVSPGMRALLTGVLARQGCAVIRGQAAELAMTRTETVTRAAYRQTVVGKTSGLFEMPVEGGALLAGLEPAAAAAIGAAIRPLGVLFQMQDDVLDLFGDKGRSAPGSDVREGKMSALVVEHLALHPGDASWLLGILRVPRDETPGTAVAEVIERFRAGGALASVWRQIESLADEVRDSSVLRSHASLASIAQRLIDEVLAPLRPVV